MDIIYNSQLNAFVVNKFQALKSIKRKGYSIFKIQSSGADKEKEYVFKPEELDELVTKRDGYEAFSISLNLMEMSHFLLTKFERKETKKNTPRRSRRSKKKRKGRVGSSSPRKSARSDFRQSGGSFKDYLEKRFGAETEIGQAIQSVFNILFISNEEFKIKIDPAKLRAYILSYSLFKVKDKKVKEGQQNILDGFIGVKKNKKKM